MPFSYRKDGRGLFIVEPEETLQEGQEAFIPQKQPQETKPGHGHRKALRRGDRGNISGR